jgi:hypothetical protein
MRVIKPGWSCPGNFGGSYNNHFEFI